MDPTKKQGGGFPQEDEKQRRSEQVPEKHREQRQPGKPGEDGQGGGGGGGYSQEP